MAGLQYKFFPTDFLYPRLPSSDVIPDNVVVSVVPPKPDDPAAKPKGPIHHQTFLQANKKAVVEPIVSRSPK
ncbi:unnamed protein product, partial [Citrullus colocynthis]